MGLKGAILGDIAGSPYEFSDQYMLDIRRRNGYELFEDISCQCTDDSIMSVACMEACCTDMDFAKYYRNYGRKYPGAGYGRHFGMWIFRNSGPYNSFGNGSAMRASYCGQAFPLEGPGITVADAAKMSAEVTHNHPEGIKGAVVLATCVAMAENGASKEEILKYGISQYPSIEYKYGCDVPYDFYKNIMRFDVSCQGSVPVAIRCFYESNSFEECMRMINDMLCDTDTVGAIAGAICESFYGNCLGSTEADEEIIRHFLPKDLCKIMENFDELSSVQK